MVVRCDNIIKLSTLLPRIGNAGKHVAQAPLEDHRSLLGLNKCGDKVQEEIDLLFCGWLRPGNDDDDDRLDLAEETILGTTM